MEKYLFLDFDGVLNTANYAKRLRKEGIDHYDEFGPMFDPDTIAHLKRVVEETSCKIVLSSKWRNEGFMRMRALWKDRNLPGELLATTLILLSTTYKEARNGELFSIPERNAKALEINAWLEEFAERPCQYVIIDDENVFFQSQQEHWVQTDEISGLTYEKAQIAIEILNHGDIARVNKGETEIFPCDEYKVFVLGMDDVALPCLYIETLKEDCLIKADFDGHCEKRDINSPDLYKETEAKLIEWFPRQSKDVHAEGKTNLEWIRHVWGIIHD